MNPSIVHRTLWATSSLVFVGSVAGCGPESGTYARFDEEETAGYSSPMAIVCGEIKYTEPDGREGTQVEEYVVTAINRKLRLHPEFAAAIGMTRVSDCDGGRAFMKAYASYKGAHPAFEDGDVRDWTPPPRLGPPPGAPPDWSKIDVEKIIGGDTQTANLPVVDLLIPNGRTCTGFFIAKNWIVTAAHCLATKPDGPIGIDGKPKPIDGWYQWMVMQQGIFQVGQPIPSTRNINPDGEFLFVSQYVDPDWPGTPVTNPQFDVNSDHDVALGYVYGPWYDTFLTQFPDGGGAMRISLNAPHQGDQFAAWGWGPRVYNAGTIGDHQARSIGTAAITTVRTRQFRQFINNDFDLRTCQGDSGGPATIPLILPWGTPDAAIGVHNTFTNTTGFPACSTPSGENMWGRLDAFMPFIESRMRAWNGTNFFCGRSFNPSHTQDYATCWGTPCKGDADCPSVILKGQTFSQLCSGLNYGPGITRGQCLITKGL
jgi:hypothetical protein